MTCSQSAMDLFAGLLTIVIVFGLFHKKLPPHFKPFPDKIGLEWFWPIWIVVVAIGFYTGPDSNGRWVSRLFEFRWILILYVLISTISIFKINSQFIKRICIGLICTPLIYAYLSYFRQYDWLMDRPIWGRMVGLFASPMTFAHSFSMPFLLLLGAVIHFLYQKWTLKKSHQNLGPYSWVTITTTVLLGIAIFLTMTRGVWVAVFFSIAVGCFWISWRLGVAYLGLALSTITILFFSWGKFQTRVLQVFDPNSYDHERITLWKTNWRIFLDHPIFGVGYGQNRHLLRQYYDQMGVPAGYFESHAHNQYLHFMAGTGITGLICYLFLWYFMISKSVVAIRNYKNKGLENSLEYGLSLGCLMAQIGFVLGGLTEANFEHSKVVYMLLTLWSFNYYLYRKSTTV